MSMQQSSSKHSWLTAFVLSFIALPLLAFLLICAYGFLVWFGQIFFWGPPN